MDTSTVTENTTADQASKPRRLFRRSKTDGGSGRSPFRRVLSSPHLLFWLLSIAYFWQPLSSDQILIPKSPRAYSPWSQVEAYPANEAVRSNRLMGDSLTLTVPWRMYNHQMLLSGEIPFWNPYIFCGYPHLAALQSNALYPPVVFFDIWDPLRGLAWSMCLHLALAGSLMFWFLRRLGLGNDASTLGSVAFEFNGFFLVRMSAPSYVFTGIWTPLLLLGIHEMVTTRKWRPAWKVAVAIAMAFLGGHPQILALMLLIGGIYGSFAVLNTRRQPKQGLSTYLLRPAAMVGSAILLGITLAGFQLVPFLEMMGQTARGQASYTSFEKLALPPVALLQAGIPDLFGHPVDNDYWLREITRLVDRAPSEQNLWGFNYCGENLFTGVTTLFFAAVAVFAYRSKVALLFGGVLAAVLLILLGSPAMRLFYLAAPIFRFSRPDRIVFVGMVAVAILAAIGYQWLSDKNWTVQNGTGPRWIPWLFAASVAIAIMWPIFVHPGIDGGYGELFATVIERLAPRSAQIIVQALVTLLLAAGALVAALLARKPSRRVVGLAITLAFTLGPLFQFGWKFNPTQPQPLFAEAESLEHLADVVGPMGRVARFGGGSVLPPNISSVFGFFDVNGSSAIGLRSYVSMITGVDPQAVRRDKYFKFFRNDSLLHGRFLDLLGVRAVLSNRVLPLPEHESSKKSFKVFERRNALERFFFVDEIETYVEDSLEASRLTEEAFDPSQVALVRADSPAASLLRGESPEDTEPGAVHLVSYGAHEIELDVVTKRRRLLVSSEVHYPGWTTTIDQKEAPTILVNTAFRGVVVPPGRHTIVFRYIPRSFVVGCIVSLVGCLGLLLSLWLFPGRTKQQRSR